MDGYAINKKGRIKKEIPIFTAIQEDVQKFEFAIPDAANTAIATGGEISAATPK